MGNGNFARGFMETFPRAVESASQRKQDAWEKLWKKYDENQEQFRKGEQESKAVERKAKEYIATYDTEGKLPEGAEAVIANKIMSGFSDKQIQDLIQNGKWGVTDVPAGQVNPADEREQQQNVDQQTAGAMGLEAPQMAPEKPQGILGSVVAKGQDFVQQMALSPQEKAMRRFAQETGMTPDQIKQMMAGGTIQQIPSAQERWDKASAGITAQLPPSTQEPIPGLDVTAVLNQRNSLAKELREPVLKLETKKKSLNELYKITADNKKLIEDVGPQLLTDVAAPVAQFIRNVEAEAKGFINMLDDPNKDKNTIAQQAQKRASELNSQIESMLSKGITTTAQAKELFEMRKQLGAFTLATIYGQEGRSLSNEERILFEKAMSPGVDPVTYMQNMQALLEIQTNAVNGMAQSIATTYGGDIQNHNEIAKQYHPNFVLNADIKTYEESIKGTPQEQIYNDVISYNTANQTEPAGANAITTPDSEYVPMPINQAVQIYKQNPSPELKKFFMDTYGKDPDGL